jgi:hypothetical protein
MEVMELLGSGMMRGNAARCCKLIVWKQVKKRGGSGL